MHGHGREILDVASRRRLFECVEANPGAHLRDLARRTSLSLGTTLYHLDQLAKWGLVVIRADGGYKRYFAGYGLTPTEKDLIMALRHRSLRRIAVALVDLGSSTQRELRERVDVSRSTLSLHLGRLVEARILCRTRAHPEDRYALADAAMVARMLHDHQASLDGATTQRPLILPFHLVTATAGPDVVLQRSLADGGDA